MRNVSYIQMRFWLTSLLDLSNLQESHPSFLHKKWSFSLRISPVKVNKPTVSCGFGHIYWRNLNGKLIFLCSVSSMCPTSFVFDFRNASFFYIIQNSLSYITLKPISCWYSISITLKTSGNPHFYPLKTSQNQRFSNIFGGCRNEGFWRF